MKKEIGLHPESTAHKIRELTLTSSHWCPDVNKVLTTCHHDCPFKELYTVDYMREGRKVFGNLMKEPYAYHFRLCCFNYKLDSITVESKEELGATGRGDHWFKTKIHILDDNTRNWLKKYEFKIPNKIDGGKTVACDSPWHSVEYTPLSTPKHEPPKVKYYLSIEITKPSIDAKTVEQFVGLIGEGLVRCENFFLKIYVIRESFRGNLERIFNPGEYKVLKKIAVPKD